MIIRNLSLHAEKRKGRQALRALCTRSMALAVITSVGQLASPYPSTINFTFRVNLFFTTQFFTTGT